MLTGDLAGFHKYWRSLYAYDNTKQLHGYIKEQHTLPASGKYAFRISAWIPKIIFEGFSGVSKFLQASNGTVSSI